MKPSSIELQASILEYSAFSEEIWLDCPGGSNVKALNIIFGPKYMSLEWYEGLRHVASVIKANIIAMERTDELLFS